MITSRYRMLLMILLASLLFYAIDAPAQSKNSPQIPTFDEYLKQQQRTKRAKKPDEIDRVLDDIVGEKTQSTWRYVTSSTEGTEVYYAPRRTVRKANGIVRTWVRYIEPESNKLESESVGLLEFDCRQERYRVLQETTYYRSGRGSSLSRRNPAWFFITPETILETVLDVVCKKGMEKYLDPPE